MKYYWVTYSYSIFGKGANFWIHHQEKRPRGRNVLGPYDTKDEARAARDEMSEMIRGDQDDY